MKEGPRDSEIQSNFTFAGDDGTLLSIGMALEEILPETPAPPRTPYCKGMVGSVKTREPESNVSYTNDPLSVHQAAERSSIYSFTLTPVPGNKTDPVLTAPVGR